MFSIRDAQTRNQAYWGLFFAAGITALALLLSIVTGTANITYGEGLGVSGWVIDDNRTANSTILVVLSAFAVFCAVKSDKKIVNLLVPVLSAVCLIINGTMTCYRSVFLILLGFAFMLADAEERTPAYWVLILLSAGLLYAGDALSVRPDSPVGPYTGRLASCAISCSLARFSAP